MFSGHLQVFVSLLTSVHSTVWNSYFPMGNKDENYSVRPSRSICCCCCWTQTLWSPWRPLSSADLRSSGGQRSSPLSTSPDSVGSTTMEGSLLDSLGYFSRESGKAWGDIWGMHIKALRRDVYSEQAQYVLSTFDMYSHVLLKILFQLVQINSPAQGGFQNLLNQLNPTPCWPGMVQRGCRSQDNPPARTVPCVEEMIAWTRVIWHEQWKWRLGRENLLCCQILVF